jgi:hypothetical protein
MDTSPLKIVPNDPDVLPALRDLFSRHPSSQYWDPEHLAAVLGAHLVVIEAALEALLVEGEVLA